MGSFAASVAPTRRGTVCGLLDDPRRRGHDVKVFLDDRRDPPDDTWVLVKTPQEVFELLATGTVTCLSLDHDLSLFENGVEIDGYSVLAHIERAIALDEIDYPIPKLTVHSGNPPAHERMQRAITAIYDLARRKGLRVHE